MRTFRSGNAILMLGWLLAATCAPSAALSASATELISNYRVSQGQGRVTRDSTLDRIARTQATAMAARDVLDHDVIGSFSSRMASSHSGRAAENIAFGHDNFPKTLNQWIQSSGHRRNLLMKGASRVGVASAKSSKTGRTYWAMVIAGDYEQPRRVAAKSAPKAAPKAAAQAPPKARSRERAKSCRLSFLGLCF